jgi:CYTH domain-containing protein
MAEGKEIEVKYLLWEKGSDYSNSNLKKLYPSVKALDSIIRSEGIIIHQGYLPLKKGLKIAKTLDLKFDFEPTIARLRDKAGKFYFALKGEGGIERDELEPEIPEYIFGKYWHLTQGKRVKKLRLEMPYDFYKYEFDLYVDRRDLKVAEVEVTDKSLIKRIMPLGKDVSFESSYKNSYLAK